MRTFAAYQNDTASARYEDEAANLDPACDHCGIDPDAIRWAALREALAACVMHGQKSKTAMAISAAILAASKKVSKP